MHNNTRGNDQHYPLYSGQAGRTRAYFLLVTVFDLSLPGHTNGLIGQFALACPGSPLRILVRLASSEYPSALPSTRISALPENLQQFTKYQVSWLAAFPPAMVCMHCCPKVLQQSYYFILKHFVQHHTKNTLYGKNKVHSPIFSLIPQATNHNP